VDLAIHQIGRALASYTLATRLVQNGMSIYEVQAILGHTDIKTTMRYAHLEQQQVAVNARDILAEIDRLRAVTATDIPR